MPIDNDLIVWSSMLDGKYTVEVTRTAPYRAELTIADGRNVLHRQPVGHCFDALFGPDLDDVHSWQATAIRFVDDLRKS
jgi:hypothetical protein